VVTVSDSRTPATDKSGDLIAERLTTNEHVVASRALVKDDPEAVRQLIADTLQSPAQALILNGGTGISSRDGTFEVVVGFLDKTLHGFGEIFRFLSYQDVGSAAMMSRAVAGVARGKIVISIPGSPNACRLAMDKLILPELGHMVFEINR
jgi:molybdenum cofactor biosynthesis protein B